VRLAAPFRAAGEHIAADLGGTHVLFTTRRGGVSTGPYTSLNLGLWTDDEPNHVHANRDHLAELAGVARGRFAQGRQVHGTHVRALADPPDPHEEPAPADGQATSVPGVAPIVLVADCLPIAVAAPGAVAMLHAGWRGLAGGVLAEGVRALRELGGGEPVVAAIGPGAGGCCYEVGEEVHTAFAAHGDAVRRGNNLDLKAIARRELEAAGVREVHDVDICTICADPALFFSHRRDGGITGRQAGVAWWD
jgi:purine-nucleoside/S-methyl-5'-thioadenosine phosphorylase / adenosine deaminase